ncbi:MAG: RnfABCDGE type electron transport complex subunit D [Candidatus Aenigmarchaeota archaeon]|nr:RnfABCDGE type electron transport complex subunit D [Candidatus Aenigmarchaeota archaeon]
MKLDVYHYMIIFLLAAAGAAMYQAQQFYPQVFVIPAVAAVTEFAILYYRTRRKELPLSAIISGLIIASIMPQLSLVAQAAAALLAVVPKQAVKMWRGSHILNPAAFSVLATSLLFSAPPSWWIGTSPVVLIFLLTANMVNRLLISVSFYAFFLLFRGSLALDYTAIFFALVMAVEPKTTPVSQKGMLAFGVWIAILAFLVQYAALGIDPLIVSLLVMNVFTKMLNKLK